MTEKAKLAHWEAEYTNLLVTQCGYAPNVAAEMAAEELVSQQEKSSCFADMDTPQDVADAEFASLQDDR